MLPPTQRCRPSASGGPPRWSGGTKLPPTVSRRYLSFAEREGIALWRAQDVGVREIARR
jgi:hypothetical protein